MRKLIIGLVLLFCCISFPVSATESPRTDYSALRAAVAPPSASVIKPLHLDKVDSYRKCYQFGLNNQNGDIYACIVLGIAYEDGNLIDLEENPIPVNYKQSQIYFATACKGGSALACSSIGQMYEQNKLKASNKSKQLFYAFLGYAVGCKTIVSEENSQEDIATACGQAGLVELKDAMNHLGTPIGGRLAKEAVTYSSKACNLGDNPSCKLLIKLNESLVK